MNNPVVDGVPHGTPSSSTANGSRVSLPEVTPVDSSEEPPIPRPTIVVTEYDNGDSPDALLDPHRRSVAAVARALDVDLDFGLNHDDAKARLERYGPNQLKEEQGVSIGKIILRQLANALSLVLIGAAALSFGFRDWIEGGVVCAVITLNVVLGFWQEYKAEKTMASLRSLSSPTANVIREGGAESVSSTSLVPGDVVVFRTGDVIPADVRLLQAINLEIDEALLTGESLPVLKSIEALSKTDVALGDRINMAWSSTTVAKGRGKGVVVGTGMNTQIGQIAAALGEDPTASQDKRLKGWAKVKQRTLQWLGLRNGTPLQIKLNKFAYILLILAAICVIIVFSAAKYKINDQVILYAIALGIGVIPESLIAVLTVTMSIGAKRMAQRHVVVRKLDALEALGGITDICSDKTGTLTQGKMVVRRIWLPSKKSFSVESGSIALEPVGRVFRDSEEPEKEEGEEVDPKALPADLKELTLAASLCNNAVIHQTDEKQFKGEGDATEIALQVYAQKVALGRSILVRSQAGVSTANNNASPATSVESIVPTIGDWVGRYSLLSEFSFDSTVKRMTSIYTDHAASTPAKEVAVYQKGAVERVLESCDSLPDGSKVNEATKQLILGQMERLAAQGLRVLAFASKTMPKLESTPKREDIESGLTFLGLAGIYDPPRPETKGAVQACRDAGIVVHMLTGDHPSTARAIALEVDIIGPDHPPSAVMTAAQFDALSEEEVDKLPALPLVIARCSPQTKVRVIAAGRRRGRFLAMTGDGANDSPALKQAPVGIGMGLAGTDVAKDASDLILTDDNFDSIRWAICEGRIIFDNIQRFLIALLVANVGEVILLLIGLAFKDHRGESVFPLSPLQILWVNMVTASLPAVGLGVEPPAANIMKRPPASLKSGIFSRNVISDTMFYGFVMGATCLLSFVALVYGPGGGELGERCNEELHGCEHIYRARSVVFAILTLENLLIAWELKSLDRSLFDLYPNSPFWKDIYANKMLFWSVIFGIITIPIALYTPTFNTRVFRHAPIGWEWGIIIGMTIVFIGSVELWKWLVRRRGWGGYWFTTPAPVSTEEQAVAAIPKDVDSTDKV